MIVTAHLQQATITMKLLLTSFFSGLYSMVVFATISQQDLLSWSATITTIVSASSLGAIAIWQRWKQVKREEDEKDSLQCQAKLDEAILRIKALGLSIKDLEKKSQEWQDLFLELKSTTVHLVDQSVINPPIDTKTEGEDKAGLNNAK